MFEISPLSSRILPEDLQNHLLTQLGLLCSKDVLGNLLRCCKSMYQRFNKALYRDITFTPKLLDKFVCGIQGIQASNPELDSSRDTSTIKNEFQAIQATFGTSQSEICKRKIHSLKYLQHLTFPDIATLHHFREKFSTFPAPSVELFKRVNKISFGYDLLTSLHVYFTQREMLGVEDYSKETSMMFMAKAFSPIDLCIDTPDGLPQAYWETGFTDSMSVLLDEWKNLESITWHGLTLQIPTLAENVIKNRFFFLNCSNADKAIYGEDEEEDKDRKGWCSKYLAEILSQVNSVFQTKPDSLGNLKIDLINLSCIHGSGPKEFVEAQSSNNPFANISKGSMNAFMAGFLGISIGGDDENGDETS
ncbi:uncharacterized protein L201_001503 [Kwoniella dendrophila CBS 6074]|uniref:F-box domain-containing protein n=1 Tax=Kwoniella dendrophila CBS 6074 TaxID=1295534 RepID=A0AAX4JMI3_9TREE